jgi:hypothetical protein
VRVPELRQRLDLPHKRGGLLAAAGRHALDGAHTAAPGGTVHDAKGAAPNHLAKDHFRWLHQPAGAPPCPLEALPRRALQPGLLLGVGGIAATTVIWQ